MGGDKSVGPIHFVLDQRSHTAYCGCRLKVRKRTIGSLFRGISTVAIPLILQIQQAALDSNSSVTDALRKAKLACTKLGLTEFGNWVDHELNGYMGIPWKDLPKYRKLHGAPEAYNPYHGWQPIIFPTAKSEANWSNTPIGMSIPAIEQSLRGASETEGYFSYPFPPESAAQLRKALPFKTEIHVKLAVPQVSEILNLFEILF
jgi:AbiTii